MKKTINVSGATPSTSRVRERKPTEKNISPRSEEHTSELQSLRQLVCRLLLEKKNVKPGDTVELGHLKFRFCAPGEKFSLSSEKEEAKPGLRPTVAELIARARECPQAAAARKS